MRDMNRYKRSMFSAVIAFLLMPFCISFAGTVRFEYDELNRLKRAEYIATTFTITASAGANGSISPSGPVSVTYGNSQTFTMTPNSGYEVADVKVDGASVGARTSYTFTGVTANRTIDAQFTAAALPIGTIAINNGAASTDNANVTLNLTCNDNVGCAQVQFSNDSVNWSSPDAYAAAKPWVLAAGDGTKTVYAKFGDVSGNWSAVYSDSIQLTPAAPAETLGLIRENCTGYTNCYTSLAAWEAAYGGVSFSGCAQGDLVCANKIAVARIEGVWNTADTQPVIIDGWTTDVNHYIRIYTTPEARHTGKWDDTRYRLVASDYFGSIRINTDYARITGLQIDNPYTGGSAPGVSFFYERSTLHLEVSHTVFRKTNSLSHEYNGAISGYRGVEWKIFNNIIYGYNVGILIRYANDNANIHVYNNTVIDSATNGIQIGSYSSNLTYRVKNNLVQGAATNYYLSGAAVADYSANISQDGTSPNTELRNRTATFIDPVNKNFHLAPGDTAARDAGISLSTDAGLAFSDDIDGNTRPGGSAWDIGADEL